MNSESIALGRWGYGICAALPVIVTVACATIGCGRNSVAQNPPPAKPATAAVETGPIVVPDGTQEELLQFIDDLAARDFKSKDREQIITELQRRHTAILAAAEKILAAPVDEATRVAAVEAKMGSLAFFINLDSPDALVNLRKYVDEVAKDPNEALATMAQQQIPDLRRFALGLGDDREGPFIFQELKDRLSGEKITDRDLQQALDDALSLAMADPAELALEAYRLIDGSLKKVEPNLAAEVRKIMQPAVRRLERVGKPVIIQGRLAGGGEIDWSKYQGKVVLVDFWATWCGPCRKELPNIKENYSRYHERGFEVVGVSIDQDKAPLTAFLAEEKLPWETIHDKELVEGGDSLAEQFGVMEIPSTFLIGRDGKLISLAARGPRLARHLERLLAAPAGKTE